MDYKKIVKDNYTLHLIKTDRFKTISFSLRFTRKFDKETYAYLNLLSKVLMFTGTKHYKSIEDIANKLEYLYNTTLGSNFSSYSNNMCFEFKSSILNPRYVKENLYEEAFSMYKEIICNPIIKKDMFLEDVFSMQKDNILHGISTIKDSPNSYGSLRFDEKFYKGTMYSENSLKNIDIYKGLDNKILYKKYKELFSEYKIDFFVVGDFDEEAVMLEADNLLKDFKQSNNYYSDLDVKLKPSQGEFKEEYKTNQSNLYIGLTTSGLTKDEKDYALGLYNAILGSMNNSLLFVRVREDNSLCYHIGSSFNIYSSSLIISAGINKKNYDKALKVIKECIDLMKEEKTVRPLINNAKKTSEIAYNDFFESPKKIMNYYYTREFNNALDIEEKRKRISKLTTKEISAVASKVKVSTVFLLEGSLNEED